MSRAYTYLLVSVFEFLLQPQRSEVPFIGKSYQPANKNKGSWRLGVMIRILFWLLTCT